MKNKLLLVNPNLGYDENAKCPPLSLIALAAFVEREGYIVDILDAPALDLDENDVFEKIIKNDADYCGFTFMTPQADQVAQLIRKIKKAKPGLILIAGGVHVSVVPEDFLKKCPEIDYLVVGEGEITLLELLNFISREKDTSHIHGLAFLKDNKPIINPKRELINDLDSLPMPAWNKLPIEKYEVKTPEEVTNVTAGLGLTISSERGCPFNCTFCASGSVFGNSFRSKSAEKIAEELKYLVDMFQIKNFFFVDEVLTLREKHVLGLCNLILQNNLQIKWTCQSRCNAKGLNEKSIQVMKDAGCMTIDFGVESGSPRILKSIKKKIELEDVYKAHKIAHDAGLRADTLIMVGHPGETMEDYKLSLKLLLYLENEIYSFGAATPFPGTELYNETVKKSYLRVQLNDWKEFYIGNPRHIARTDHFDYDEIEQLKNYANAVCRILSDLSEYKRHDKVNFIKTLKLYISLINMPKSNLSIYHKYLWVKLFLQKRINERYISRKIEKLNIKCTSTKAGGYHIFFNELVNILSKINSSPSILIVCIESKSGVNKFINQLKKYFKDNIRIYLLDNDNYDIENKIKYVSKISKISDIKFSIDMIFHFANKNTFLPLANHVFRALFFRNKIKVKTQFIVNLNLKFWRINLKTIKGIIIGEGYLEIIKMIFLPIIILHLLWITFRTRELKILGKYFPLYIDSYTNK